LLKIYYQSFSTRRKLCFHFRNRRYRYPFINCTDCGPRYTIVQQLPYDRPQTTMSEFTLCPACQQEYENPLDRRYHAQPIACPQCGPQIRLLEAQTRTQLQGGIRKAAQLIKEGFIVAVKGLGGFHLVADPFNHQAVQRLRKIKKRDKKPFALMARSLEVIEKARHPRNSSFSERNGLHASLYPPSLPSFR